MQAEQEMREAEDHMFECPDCNHDIALDGHDSDCSRRNKANLADALARPANPYCRVVTVMRRNGLEQDYVQWFFHDETFVEHGPYRSQRKALRELMKYCHWLDHGPTRWQRIWWPIKTFCADCWRLMSGTLH